ncbi:hypothetical protein [Herbiconiux ginsengi]|uniref:Uncharacterized protein n=1 Tax=Herbiconiux ginsengi TaxID=381665 RepID=A0A1H3LBR0_9MICO|nr:hypothetical protein [Herbiconiux ginsengi]SDY61842.1 hypothetical protein SAMN05216554_0913 [Herbiconiux ginsengi]
MQDYTALSAQLTSPEQLLALCDEPQVFGAKKQAQAAYALWSRAEERFVGAYQGVQAPGGTGTGFVVRVFWNPAEVTPDLGAVVEAIQSELPIAMIRDDEKATYKGRDKKQGVFFVWQGIRSRPLSQWLHERFGVYGCVTQLFAKSDLTQNVAVVAVVGGVDHLWTLTA